MVDIKARYSFRQNQAVILIHPINALIKSIRQETTRQSKEGGGGGGGGGLYAGGPYDENFTV